MAGEYPSATTIPMIAGCGYPRSSALLDPETLVRANRGGSGPFNPRAFSKAWRVRCLTSNFAALDGAVRYGRSERISTNPEHNILRRRTYTLPD